MNPYIFLYLPKNIQPKNRKSDFPPLRKVCPAVGTNCLGSVLGCASDAAQKHKLPMNFVFSPCHSLFFDSINQIGILETPHPSFAPFRPIFLFFPIFPIFTLRNIVKNNSDLGIHFRFFLLLRIIFLHTPAKNQLKTRSIEFFRGGVTTQTEGMFPPATSAMSLKAL